MTVVLVRHAERDLSGSDALSSAGKQRAALLARMFSESGISAIFTSEFARTKQTAAPLAQELGITPRAIDSDTNAARNQVMSAGPAPLVIGHSNTVPELIAALGGTAGIEIDDGEFDHMFVVSITSGGVSTLAFRYVNA
jgi:phosphohistidine phosphatase SixA